MQTKYMNYLLIVLLTLSLIPPLQLTNTMAEQSGLDRNLTTDNFQDREIQSQDFLNPENTNIVNNNRNDPKLSSRSSDNSRSEFNRRSRTQIGNFDSNKVENLPTYLSTWFDLTNELQSEGITTSYNFDDSALLHFKNKAVEYLIETTDGLISEEMISILEKNGVVMKKNYSNRNFHVVTVPIETMESFVLEISLVTNVENVEPNFYAKTTYVPNDPLYNDQYGPQIIGMESAWDISLGSQDVLVAVIDTGIDYTHSELISNYVPLGYDHYNDDADPWDDEGHGTHVAGTIAAGIGNSIGIAGVANVSVMAEKFLDEFGFGSYADAVSAIDHAVAAGADILSNSWSGSGFSDILNQAIQDAIASGVIFVAAAGNDATSSPRYPAYYDNVIAVSATDSSDNFAGFSNYGDWIDIAAPGVGVLSTLPSESYAYYDGTSMATPHVSGLLALLMSVYPEYTPIQLENLLYSTAVDLGDSGFDHYYGHGRIDASSAIFGIQDNDVRAELSAPDIVANGDDLEVIYGVSNIGLEAQYDVLVELTYNNGFLANFTVPVLEPGNSSYGSYFISQPPLGEYTFFSFTPPVTNETSLVNNEKMKIVTVSDPIIFPQVGDKLYYSQNPASKPFEFGWEVIDASDPKAVIVAEVGYDPEFDEVFYFAEYTLNTFTREFSDIWELFPYWVNPNVSIGDTIDLFTRGSGQGEVIDEGFINYYGYDIEVWIVDDGFELVYFTKSMGNLLQVEDYGNTAFISTSYTNVHPNVLVTNQLIQINEPLLGSVGEATEIDVLVFNSGDTSHSTEIEFLVNGNSTSGSLVSLNGGQWTHVLFYFTPSEFGIYNITISLDTVTGELLSEDNVIETTLSVIELDNYNLVNSPFSWYDAQSNGFNLNLFGDDTSTSVDFPFDFNYYDSTFDIVHVSSNGWLSFYESDPWQYFTNPIPNEEHPYMVAPFFSDLVAEGNVYAWITQDFVVVEYVDYFYLWGDEVGTFEVVFFANGDILFQYQDVSYDDTQAKGLNYGLNLNYYTSLDQDLGGVINYAGLFTLNNVTNPPPGDGPDLAAGLNLPYPLNPGTSDFVQASATNIGNTSMFNVQVLLFIDGEFVSQMITQLLEVGDSITLNYYWENVEYGPHTIDVEVVIDPSETDTSNNYIFENIFVSDDIDDHDLAVYLQFTEYDQFIQIDAIVYNEGFVPEYDIELFIQIDDTIVTFGVIDALEVGLGTAVSYIWNSPQPGFYNITAYTPVIVPEFNEANNIVVQLYEVTADEPDRFVLQLYDFDTLEPIQDAYVDIYGVNTGEFYYGYTNSSGGLTLNVAADEYYLFIDPFGYETYYDIILVDGESFFEIYLTAFQLNETLNIQVIDNSTQQPIADVDVNIYGDSTGFYAYSRTDANGVANFTVPEDYFNINIVSNGYSDYYDFVYVVGDIYLEVFMIPIEFDSELTLQVYDSDTLDPIFGASVYIYGSSTGYSENNLTDINGITTFVVPEDYYNIDIYAPGYIDYYNYIFVSGDVSLEIYLSTAVIDTELTIQIFNSDTLEPVVLANINMFGFSSGFEIYGQTNATGSVTFNVPTDNYDIFINKNGYEQYYDFIFVTGIAYYEVYLDPIISDIIFTVQVFDNSTLIPLSDIQVNIWGSSTGNNAYGDTNTNGIIEFLVPADDYNLDVFSNDHYNYYDYVSVFSDTYFEVYLIAYELTEELSIQVYDNDTLAPVEGANVNIYGDQSGFYQSAQTDDIGFVSFIVPEDGYNINIDSNDYYNYYDFVYVIGEVFLEIYLIPVVFDSELTIQFYDANTLEPVSDAGVNIWGYNTAYSDYRNSNSTGAVNFIVPSDIYDINVNAQNYEYYYDQVYVDGAVYYEIYLAPIEFDSTLAIQVTDIDNGNVLSFVLVFVTGTNSGFFTVGETNSSGYIEFEVPEDEYFITLQVSGYYDLNEQVYVSGFTYVSLEMIPSGSNEIGLTITGPSDNGTIIGSTVYVTYEWIGEFAPENVDVYVDGVFITTVTTITGQILVPMFSDGSHWIDLVGNWPSGSASNSVEVEVLGVSPVVEIEVNDYFNLHLSTFDGTLNLSYYFAVVSQISEFEYYLNLTIVNENLDGTTYTDYYMVVNVLNGYISDTDHPWLYYKFPFVTSISTQDPSSASYGVINWIGWGDVFLPTSTILFNGEDAFVYSNDFIEHIYLVETGFWMQSLEEEFYIVTTESSVFDTISTPIIDPLNDQSMEFGTTGNELVWNVTTFDTSYYNISVNGEIVVMNILLNSSSISFSLDGLELGSYGIELTLFDINGNSVSDNVMVYVVDTIPPDVSAFENTFEVYEGEDVTVLFNASDSHPNVLLIDFNTSLYDVVNWTNGEFEYVFTNLSVGNYEFTFMFYDTSWNQFNVSIFISVFEEPIPEIVPLDDFTIEFGTSDNELIWNVTTFEPTFYNLTLNGLPVVEDAMVNDLIIFDLDGLAVGSYTFELIVFEADGDYNFDTVIVEVRDTTSPEVVLYDSSFEIYEGENATVTFNTTDFHPGILYVLYNVTNFVDQLNWSNGVFDYVLTGFSVGYYEITFQFLDQYYNSANVTVYLLVIENDEVIPHIRGPHDFSYEEGAENNYILWDIVDDSSTSYTILLNGDVYQEGNVEGDFVEIQVDGFEIDRYNFTIIVMDSFGNTAVDEVIMYVIPIADNPGRVPGRLSGFTTIYSLLGLLGVAFFLRRRTMNKAI